MSGVAQQEGTNPHVRKGIPNPYLCSVQGALGSFGLCLARLNVTLCLPSGEESRFWVFLYFPSDTKAYLRKYWPHSRERHLLCRCELFWSTQRPRKGSGSLLPLPHIARVNSKNGTLFLAVLEMIVSTHNLNHHHRNCLQVLLWSLTCEEALCHCLIFHL